MGDSVSSQGGQTIVLQHPILSSARPPTPHMASLWPNAKSSQPLPAPGKNSTADPRE